MRPGRSWLGTGFPAGLVVGVSVPISSAQPSFLASRRAVLLAAIVLMIAAVAAYHNSFSAPFTFDDNSAIIKNQTIRHLWPIGGALSPPVEGGGVCGRPLVNLSLAVNYAISGTDVWSYHALNLVIHVLAGLTLFGVTRRTFLQPPLRARFGAVAAPLALAVAGLWVLHPLQTESVTFVVQRNESLMGLFYLLTLYAFIRGTGMPSSSRWLVLSALACLLGMASKEVMASAPLIVLVYDWTFVAGTFRGAWRQRRSYYVTLAATWLLLGWLMVGSHQRGGAVGFGLGVTPWSYALTQCRAIVHYLRLSFWPHPLVVDYGAAVVRSLGEVWWQATVVLAMLGLTIWALIRKPRRGFLGLWFFAILAPSSSVVPLTTQTLAEHRMYLPLAAVIALVVTGTYSYLGRTSLAVFVALAAGAALLTERRNDDYRDAVSLWSATVASCPDNPRAHHNLSSSLLQAHRLTEATAQAEMALKLRPDYADAQDNLGNALWMAGRVAEAAPHYQEALRLNPRSAEAHSNLGNVRLMEGKTAEAIALYEEALRLDASHVEARNNLGYALLVSGNAAAAAAQFEAVLQVKPDSAEVHNNLGEARLQLGQRAEAIRQFERALELKPDLSRARSNLERTRP
jgi:protein O-mannosyl-transferase